MSGIRMTFVLAAARKPRGSAGRAAARHVRATWIQLAAFVLLGSLSAVASADRSSSFRLVGVEPAHRGALLLIAFDNDWGPEDTQANSQVDFFGHTRRPPRWDPRRDQIRGQIVDRSMPLGRHRLLGVGTLKLPVDYVACKVRPGQKLCLSAVWVTSEHRWGEWWADLGRSAGEVTLPPPLAAAQNSALGRGAARWLPRSGLALKARSGPARRAGWQRCSGYQGGESNQGSRAGSSPRTWERAR